MSLATIQDLNCNTQESTQETKTKFIVHISDTGVTLKKIKVIKPTMCTQESTQESKKLNL